MAAQTLPGWENFAQLLAAPQAGANPLAPKPGRPGVALPVPGAGPPVSPAASTGLPGIEGLSTQASQLISSLMSGQLSNEEQGVIRTNRAQQAQTSGMPGTGMLQNTLHGNATLRDLGIATGERQRQGLSDLNSLMNSYYGNVTPTAGQRLSADVTLAGQDKDVAIQTRKLDEAASQFQQSFGFEEKKLAQQLGLSEKELAYKLAALAADTANQQGDLALRTAELNQNASQFAQNRELAPTDIATLAASPHAPPGTLATLLAKYGAAPNFDQLAATGTGISSSTIGRY